MTNNSKLPSAVENILNVARWAPSGDNAQPWTFEIQRDGSLLVCIRHHSDNVYEYRDGEPTLISAGALLENIVIAAPTFGKKASWRYVGRENILDRVLVQFEDMLSEGRDDLFDCIPQRSVDRRAFKKVPLTAAQKRALEESTGELVNVRWFEGFGDKWKIANLCRQATDIRLRIPETFEIHNRIVDWERTESPNAIPAKALGLDALTVRMMRWTLANQTRTKVANKLGSPFFAALQMDLIPGLSSAGYFTFEVPSRSFGPAEAVVQMLKVGQALQRFWLTATKLGLAMQPCVAMLAFSHYGISEQPFTVSKAQRRASIGLAQRAQKTFPNFSTIVFAGRIGLPIGPVVARSTRLPLPSLMR